MVLEREDWSGWIPLLRVFQDRLVRRLVRRLEVVRRWSAVRTGE